MRNQQQIQGIISIIALFCLVVGWFNLFSPEINNLLSRKIFYVLIGISFFLQAPFLKNKNFSYGMYAAAAVCVLGGLLIPVGSGMESLKTLAVFVGLIITFSGRQSYRQ
ncbi:hypothetical protein [uncultured Chryseobacterium sp.]|uniref:hypothetical protein n=1 Tax=uncultured Chryseobacterium sp. TaxID=259322 RepID=UPI0025E8C7DD|nr:hypothetical protein [uncultured Chryseobacterium sp.]